MNDPTHNNAMKTNASFPDEYDELSSFMFRYMNNTPDMYATYSQTTELCDQTPQIVNERLTEDIIKQHLHADHQSDLIGVPTVNSEDNTCRFVMICIRESEDDSEEPTQVESDPEGLSFSLRDQAIEIYYMLLLNGIAPILCESPNMDAYQIWIVWKKPMPASQVIHFGDAIVACCQHRMPTSTSYLHHAEDVNDDYPVILTEGTRIDVYPMGQLPNRNTKNEFVPLPCLMENSFDYMENGYDVLGERGKRIFMGGLSLSDNSYELHLNDPSRIDPEHFVYDPIMTSMEVDQVQFTGSEKPIEKFLSRIKGVQPCGRGSKGCCTSHIDFTRSLLVSEDEDGYVQIYCSKGCTLANILKPLDPSTKDRLLRVDQHSKGVIRVARRDSRPRQFRDIKPIAEYKANRSHTTQDQIEELAAFLRVSPESLEELEVAYDQFGKGCLFPTHSRFHGSLKGVQSCRNLSQAVREAVPGELNGMSGLFIPRSFDINQPEIIIANYGINTAVGLTLGWNVIGRMGDCITELIRLLKEATGEIRVMKSYCPSMDDKSFGTMNSDSVEIDEYVLSDIEKRCDMDVYEVPSHLLDVVYSSRKSFARSLQQHVTARVSIIDVPREFRAIRLAAYLKSQSE